MNFARAACRGMDVSLFYTHESRRGLEARSLIANARDICQSCPIQIQCLVEAMNLEAGQHLTNRSGIWGGFTAVERANLARRAQGAAVA